MGNAIAVSGHRPEAFTEAQKISAVAGLRETFLAIRHDYDHDVLFYVGGALGVDEWARQELRRLNLRHLLVIPHMEYRGYWERAGLGAAWDQMLAEAWRGERGGGSCLGVIEVVPPTSPWHFSHNFKRNDWMVQRSRELVAVYKGDIGDCRFLKKGGTVHAVREAMKFDIPIRHVDPR